VSADAPAVPSAADRGPERIPAEQRDRDLTATPFLWLARFYQRVISPVDGDRCPMYPTCSQYFVHAARKHGPVMGTVMTAGRLMHEPDEKAYVPLVRVGNRLRYLDPVENNDFWWHRP
jgi:hypothetical protein